MNNTEEHRPPSTRYTSKWVVAFFVLSGLLLIAVSVPLKNTFWHELLKELGIVLLSVFVISWLYEITVAEKYFRAFSYRLCEIIETGESLTAACQQLGIIRIYPRRDHFEREYPIIDLLSRLGDAGALQICARSLFHIANKPEILKEALKRSFEVLICICDPAVKDQKVLTLTDTQAVDIQAALGALKSEILPWLNQTLPPGSVEIRTHDQLLFDTLLSISSGSLGWVVMDLSFGRDLTAKRVLLIDALKPLGGDFLKRYERFYSQATPVFKYAGRKVVLNSLP